MDLLRKAERDLCELESAIVAQDERRIGDVLYNFSVLITSIKDWAQGPPIEFIHRGRRRGPRIGEHCAQFLSRHSKRKQTPLYHTL
jgi:hypothetical protein